MTDDFNPNVPEPVEELESEWNCEIDGHDFIYIAAEQRHACRWCDYDRPADWF